MSLSAQTRPPAGAAAPPLIEARGLTRILPGLVPVTLVRDIDLTIGAGEFVAITGPSGSGKSSLLYLLGLLDAPTRGEVLINGHPTHLHSETRRARERLSTLGFVFQFHFLLPEFSVAENVMIPMRKLKRLGTRDMRARAVRMLGELGLEEHVDKLPIQLSGGQRQRVAVARALANDPPAILADEPTGSLDSKSSEQVFQILRKLVDDHGKTVIAVTHDLEMAARMDRRLHLVDGMLADP
ncbi:ABC transporter ATP-binding protein [Stappia stellulata]|uniref:ABC transporter ATP-binding protein n=1 Tax=Stappia stellulata TaxID=71235 RepID=UPI0003F5099A|nr:ABC transporter ATP-binding protein [Stappia stellulata]